MQSLGTWWGVPVAWAEINYPGDHLHAPNENIRLDLFHKGVLHLVAIVERQAKGQTDRMYPRVYFLLDCS